MDKEPEVKPKGDKGDCKWHINGCCRRHIISNECQPIDHNRCEICLKYQRG
jgi:hypothetical protein